MAMARKISPISKYFPNGFFEVQSAYGVHKVVDIYQNIVWMMFAERLDAEKECSILNNGKYIENYSGLFDLDKTHHLTVFEKRAERW